MGIASLERLDGWVDGRETGKGGGWIDGRIDELTDCRFLSYLYSPLNSSLPSRYTGQPVIHPSIRQMSGDISRASLLPGTQRRVAVTKPLS